MDIFKILFFSWLCYMTDYIAISMGWFHICIINNEITKLTLWLTRLNLTKSNWLMKTIWTNSIHTYTKIIVDRKLKFYKCNASFWTGTICQMPQLVRIPYLAPWLMHHTNSCAFISIFSRLYNKYFSATNWNHSM